ncbi:MAG: 16S rRNA (adenine(1518)-N(6)/adenine(1519)-N(6))-dimethyltransferase RsmA [Alphaproteobacteria bacterium]|nr:16S rRNA (adenine(1518)-N(6)/adenine(1519)-N(6))-dimethyltransferase RsmA [Alphaproteobacteria bacterium]
MTELPTLKETVDKYGLLAKRSLGQNFLLDQNITGKIIRTSLETRGLTDFSHEDVYEIGPGPGGLTRAVLNASPHRLTVIEMDSRCIAIMQELQTFFPQVLRIIEGDALAFDYHEETSYPKSIVSNLPYNISVPLLLGWIKSITHFNSLTLMFQKEVAERIMAPCHNKSYGRLSVIAQLTCHIKSLMTLNPQCFVPAPKIWSTVLLFTPKADAPSPQVLHQVELITELAFSQRRKMIRQSLKTLEGLENVCQKINIDLTARAENISCEQYRQMAELMLEQNQNK